MIQTKNLKKLKNLLNLLAHNDIKSLRNLIKYLI